MGKTYQWPGDWGAWDEFTQYRRPHPMRVEFRRSVPLGLLIGVLLVLAAISLTFLGLWVPGQGLGTGVPVAAAGLAVFILGRGTVVDGTRGVVRHWSCTIRSTSSETPVGRFWSNPVRGSQKRVSWPRNFLSSSPRLSPINPASHWTSTSKFSEVTTNHIRLSPYSVTATIGEGGKGEVYRARD